MIEYRDYDPSDREDVLSCILERGWSNCRTRYGRCEGFVYIVATKDHSHVKIGFSKSDPRLRMAALQTGNPKPLILISFTPGCLAMERAFHERLNVYRVSGEWFECTEEAVSILRELLDNRELEEG